jgi:hypothetical protein
MVDSQYLPRYNQPSVFRSAHSAAGGLVNTTTMKKDPKKDDEAMLRYLKNKADWRAKHTPRELELYWLAIEFEQAHAEIYKKCHARTPYGDLVTEYTPLMDEAVAAVLDPGAPGETIASGQELLDTMRALLALRDDGEGGAGQDDLPTGDFGPTMTPPKPKDMDR